MTMVSINAGEWLIARGEIHARGGPREINAYLLGREGPFLTPGQRDWTLNCAHGHCACTGSPTCSPAPA